MTSGIEPLDQLRAICLALPEASEAGGVGRPSFKVRGKIFAMRHRHAGRWSMWCKAPPGVQALLVEADPTRFFVPPYVGARGWVGLRLDRGPLDWEEVADLLTDSYRLIAPKRLAASLVQQTPV